MGKLMAAAVKRDITPSGEILELVNQEGRYSYEGIGHSLSLRTLVLSDGMERFVFFGTELSSFVINDEAKKIFKYKLGLDEKDYMFGANRSHNTISGWGNDLHDPKKPGSAAYGRFVIDQMVSAVEEAMSKLVPARIGAALGESNINVFREVCSPAGNYEGMNHSGTQQRAPWLRVVRVEDLQGDTIALLVNYCMQNCMIAWNGFTGEYNYVTPDLAGEIADYLERAGKHQYPVIWSNGGGADQQPLIYSLNDHVEVDDEGNYSLVHEVLPFEAMRMLMKTFAAEHAGDVLRTAGSIHAYSDEFNYFSDVVYADVPGKIPLSEKMYFYHPGEDDVHPEPAAPIRFRYSMAVINGIAFCGVNCPVYSGSYGKLKEMLPFDVTVFSDDNFGGIGMASIPLPEAEENDRYVHATLQSKSYTARIGFNAFMAGFGKMLEKYMLKTIYTYKNAPYPEERK